MHNVAMSNATMQKLHSIRIEDTHSDCSFGMPKNASYGMVVISLCDISRSCSWPNPLNGLPCTESMRLPDKSLFKQI